MCRWGVLRGVARAGEDEVYTNSYVMQVEIIWRVEASVGGGGFKCFLHPPPLLPCSSTWALEAGLNYVLREDIIMRVLKLWRREKRGKRGEMGAKLQMCSLSINDGN